MLTRNLKRALLDPRWPMPPTFLLPWTACLTTLSHTTHPSSPRPPSPGSAQHAVDDNTVHESRPSRSSPLPSGASAAPLPAPPTRASPPQLSSSVRSLLPLLQAQGAHYITAHIHDRPYLLTQGDTLRLPFFMKDVQPGDVLRLNRASNLGSRDYTLKASTPAPKLTSATMTREARPGHTMSGDAREDLTGPGPESDGVGPAVAAPHFIPHIAKGKVSYLDERLFVCRAVVMGVESEPMRTMEKTKRRQRKVKTVKSKHRYTILRIKELRVRDIDEIEAGLDG
jgi:large subunit ribosomal protein L21